MAVHMCNFYFGFFLNYVESYETYTKKCRLLLCCSFQNFEIAPHPFGTPMISDPKIRKIGNSCYHEEKRDS